MVQILPKVDKFRQKFDGGRNDYVEIKQKKCAQLGRICSSQNLHMLLKLHSKSTKNRRGDNNLVPS